MLRSLKIRCKLNPKEETINNEITYKDATEIKNKYQEAMDNNVDHMILIMDGRKDMSPSRKEMSETMRRDKASHRLIKKDS